MGILGKLKGGSQVLAKTAIANYIVEVENVVPVPVNRNELLRNIQDKCGLVDEADFEKLTHDINSLCEPIKHQQLNYIDRAGNLAFKAHKVANSPAKIQKNKIQKNLEAAEEQLSKTLTQAVSLSA